ncbi:MAG: CinA family protein [Bacteroidetes bacterium]|uniref:CinA family protein n=1 Tax=Candidatus Cryptobacteroides avistercoris TaxID=2840758 RepID=A0A9D9NN94_9BACT|nr:CinA family protein [Candidatus Cryptobacteroides avistercoris]
MKEKQQYRIARLLKGSGKTLSAAESCTGGEISHLITTVSGSSEYYLGSVTSYAIPIKERLLGVPAETVETFGVVSPEVAAAMAEGVRKATGSDYSVATTGLAEGGDGHYPEGTVWMAVSGPSGTRTRLFSCNLGRRGNIRQFAKAALKFLADYIENQ